MPKPGPDPLVPQTPPGAEPRVVFLDGLRGYAALQVVLTHYVLAFAPAIGNISPATAHPAWQNLFIHSPLFFFADGYVAVSIFFLISGAALTYSFEASTKSITTQTLRRVARLGLPMAAAILLGAIWYACLPNAHAIAAALLGGDGWLRDNGPDLVSPLPVLKEMITALVLGHAHFSLILPGKIGEYVGLPGLDQSYDAPLWTLHLEFYGSLLVLVLVQMQRRLRRGAYRLFCCLLLGGLFFHPLGLFVLGHLAVRMQKSRIWRNLLPRTGTKILAAAALAAGICMSAHVAPAKFMHEYDHFIRFEPLPMKADDFHFFSQFGAILIFFGVLALPRLQRAIAGGIGRLLGRYSFSVYLVHYPILTTLTAFLTIQLLPLGHYYSIVLASIIGLAVTACITVIFERWVDQPATAFSRRLKISRTTRLWRRRRAPAA